MISNRTSLQGALAALLTGAMIAWPSASEASIFDLGVQGGVMKRTLSEIDYNTSFAWQLHGEMTFFPFFMAGPYVTFTSATAQLGAAETPSKIDFRTLGMRLKLKIPITHSFAPFGIAGAGWAHADFPDQILNICEPNPQLCFQKAVPSATANFAEFIVGGGVMWTFAAPFAATAEFNWRPTAGYTNDVYERQIQSRQTAAPDPGRNGVAWVGLLGLELTL